MNKHTTIKDLLEDEARISIKFYHAQTEEEAKEKIAPYTAFGEISDLVVADGAKWFEIKTGDFNIEITSFLE